MRFFVMVLLWGVTLAPAVAGEQFSIEGEGTVVWVADGDSFYFRPDNALMWLALRKRARRAQAKTDRALRVDDRFRRDDMSFLVRVGNVDAAETAPAGQGAGNRAEAFARSLLEGTQGELFCWEIGHYGRPVCSFWTDEWEYGRVLIERGHSDYKTRFGRHPRFHEAYQRAERQR